MVRNGEVSHILASWMSNTATCLGGWQPTFGGQLGGCSHLHYIPEYARTCRCRSGARHPLWTISDLGKASGPFFAFSWTWVEKDCATGGGFAMTGRLMVCDGSGARRRHSDCHVPSSLGGGEESGRERSGSGPAFHGSVDVCWGRVPFGGETCELPGLSRGGRPSGIEFVLWTGSAVSLIPTGRQRTAESDREPSSATAYVRRFEGSDRSYRGCQVGDAGGGTSRGRLYVKV